MRQLCILLRDHKIIENLLSPSWLHRVVGVESALQASLSIQDFER